MPKFDVRWVYRRIALLLWLSICVTGNAIAELRLSLENVTASGIRIEGVRLAVTTGKNAANLRLTIDKIGLPAPFDVLSFFELRCPRFSFSHTGLSCSGGQAKIVSPWLDRGDVLVDFQVSKENSSLQLRWLKFAGGTLLLAMHYSNDNWHAEIFASNVKAQALQRLTAIKSFAVSGGRVDLRAEAQGRGAEAENMQASLELRQLDAQSADGKYAAENLYLKTELDGKITANLWQWRQKTEIGRGAFYVDPVYIAAYEHALELRGNAAWLPRTQQLRLDDWRLTHKDVVWVETSLTFQNGALANGNVSMQSDSLGKFSEIYLQPFIAATPWEGIGLTGHMQTQAEFNGHHITRIDIKLPRLQISDNAQRFALQNGSGAIHWANNRLQETSSLSWDNFNIYGLPIGKAALEFSAYGKSLRLARPTDLPLLDGSLHISRCEWQMIDNAEPLVHFHGNIERVSLEKLSDALNWTPLSGQLSGTVPGVRYHNGQLDIDGALSMRLFDGTININNLRLSGMLGNLPQLQADVELDNLDLQKITGRFPFGGMQGRLSGYIRALQLQNWQPVTFFAWLGTPDGDTSKHRISQKAVNSLASIGGGSVTDVVSRVLLRAFDNFGYDRLGIGCYLHNGVCQLFGVEAAQQGFYIVTGGGLPRIDVIGYNSRIDWQILLQRLRRILATEQAIIQ